MATAETQLEFENVQPSGDLAHLISECENDAGGYEQPEAPEVETAEVLYMVIHPLFNVMAPAWNIQEVESRQLAEVYGALLDKYWPDSAALMGVELSAALTTLAILGPRLGKPRKFEEQPEKQKKAEPEPESKQPKQAADAGVDWMEQEA